MTKNTKAAPVDDPVDAANVEVLRLRNRELELWHERRRMVASLLELERTSGAAVAEGGSVAEAGRQLANGRAAVDVFDRAADEVARQREAAIPTTWRAQAAAMRASEAAKRAEAQERVVRTRQLLAELKQHEGVDYAPAGARPGQGHAPSPGLNVWQPSITERMLMEADEEGRAASALERQELNPRAGGQVEADTIEDLVVAVLGDGRRVVPPLRDIEKWAAEAEQAARVRLQRARDGFGEPTPDPDSAPAIWTVSWRGHDLAAGSSGVSLLGRAGTSVIDDYGDAPGESEEYRRREAERLAAINARRAVGAHAEPAEAVPSRSPYDAGSPTAAETVDVGDLEAIEAE